MVHVQALFSIHGGNYPENVIEKYYIVQELVYLTLVYFLVDDVS